MAEAARERVVRGGSWNNDNEDNFRCANRNNNDPQKRNNNQGFRVASTLAAGARWSTDNRGAQARAQASSWLSRGDSRITKRRRGLVAVPAAKAPDAPTPGAEQVLSTSVARRRLCQIVHTQRYAEVPEGARMQRASQELLIIDKAFALAREMTRRTQKLPRDLKFVLGDRMVATTYDVLDLLLEAKYSRQKGPLLAKANIALERLRFQVRLCAEERLISLRQYEFVAGLIDEVGRMLGGWLKHLSS